MAGGQASGWLAALWLTGGLAGSIALWLAGGLPACLPACVADSGWPCRHALPALTISLLTSAHPPTHRATHFCLQADGTLVVPPFDNALAGITVQRMMELLPEVCLCMCVVVVVGGWVWRQQSFQW